MEFPRMKIVLLMFVSLSITNSYVLRRVSFDTKNWSSSGGNFGNYFTIRFAKYNSDGTDSAKTFSFDQTVNLLKYEIDDAGTITYDDPATTPNYDYGKEIYRSLVIDGTGRNVKGLSYVMWDVALYGGLDACDTWVNDGMDNPIVSNHGNPILSAKIKYFNCPASATAFANYMSVIGSAANVYLNLNDPDNSSCPKLNTSAIQSCSLLKGLIFGTSRPDQTQTCIDAECFPSSAILFTRNGKKRISELRTTDIVLTASKKNMRNDDGSSEAFYPVYSQFVNFIHFDNAKEAIFLKLRTDDGSELDVTATHRIFVKKIEYKQNLYESPTIVTQDYLATSQANVGDFLLKYDESRDIFNWRKIVNISSFREIGVYSPLTFHGTAVVNGFLTSNYSHRHSVTQILLFPLRLSYYLGFNEINFDGIHPYCNFFYKIYQEIYESNRLSKN